MVKPVWKKVYRTAEKAQDFQNEREVCPSVWLGNIKIDETTDQEIADIYQQVSTEDPEYSLARGHLNEGLWERTKKALIGTGLGSRRSRLKQCWRPSVPD